MADRNYFAHETPEGLDPTGRGSLVGYSCYKDYGSYYTTGIAENIFKGWTYSTTHFTNGIETSRDWLTSQELAADTVMGWMNSPGHRANILTATYDREGIGIAIGSDYSVYVTEDFC
jgi:uncharacterized protein YkwD